jgi:hypothetical protein
MTKPPLTELGIGGRRNPPDAPEMDTAEALALALFLLDDARNPGRDGPAALFTEAGAQDVARIRTALKRARSLK